jgi:DNA modification methylase
VNYDDFLSTKIIKAEPSGVAIAPEGISPVLFDFQRDIVRWALRRGRAAIFADCGLGKTLMQLEWARHVMKQYTCRILIAAPLSVGAQTVEEAHKLDMDVKQVRKPDELRGCGVHICNYEMIKHFIGVPLDGIVLDESSILKSLDGKTRKMLLEHFTDIPWRLCCTATPAPNDIAELGNHAQFLGVMRREDMLASFFVHDDKGWRLRGYARKPFYRWLASWSMSLKGPEDLGYDGADFVLPELRIHNEVVKSDWRRDGWLFPGGLKGIGDRASVRKETVSDRVMRARKIISETKGQVLVWCGLNEEATMMARSFPNEAVNVRGQDSQESKIENIMAFVNGDVRVLVTKPKICGFGMNFQNAATAVFLGLSDSYESYYQCIRRCWRYGQHKPVDVHIIVTDHEQEIVANVKRKERQALEITTEVVNAAREFEMEELQGHRAEVEVVETALHEGEKWTLYQGDVCEEIKKMEDESVDLSVFSPPFLALYQYTASERDMGNCETDAQFMEHFHFVCDELLRITKPGRLCAVHCADTVTTLVTHGVIGMKDFPGMLVEEFESRGWVYHGSVCIDKDPQAQAIRTHAKGLLFVQLKKDASWMRPALADYIKLFRKPGENPEPIKSELSNDQWIEWARPIWYGIRESNTLNVREARSADDDKHICALQLETIERCIKMWSNPGDVVFSPFAGIGSELVQAVKFGRIGVGCELKPLYCEVAVKNLKKAERESHELTLLDVAEGRTDDVEMGEAEELQVQGARD